MGAYAKSKGMFFTVHHHMGTGVQTVEEIDKLMDMTDPDLVYLLFDSVILPLQVSTLFLF